MNTKIIQLKEIMALLRDPIKGCPWDIKQDSLSIAPCTIEEAYEVVDAIESGDAASLKEELGDLLLQVVFHSQIASEQGKFNFEDVVEAIVNKLISRHPHVFGDAEIKTASEQEVSWEKLKEEERKNKTLNNATHSLLDGIAKALPASLRAEKLQKRAAKAGFDWSDLTGVYEKIQEELLEVREAISEQKNIKEEVGDLLFSVINLARKLEVNPEEALRYTNSKFERRFHYIETELAKNGLDIFNTSLSEMDRLWVKAKEMEKA